MTEESNVREVDLPTLMQAHTLSLAEVKEALGPLFPIRREANGREIYDAADAEPVIAGYIKQWYPARKAAAEAVQTVDETLAPTMRFRWLQPMVLDGAPRRLQQCFIAQFGEERWIDVPAVADPEAFRG